MNKKFPRCHKRMYLVRTGQNLARFADELCTKAWTCSAAIGNVRSTTRKRATKIIMCTHMDIVMKDKVLFFDN